MDKPARRTPTGQSVPPADPAPVAPDMGATTAPSAPAQGPAMGSTQAFDETQPPARSAPSGQRGAPAGTQQPANAGQKFTTLGDFKLLKKLGAGGMGEVFKGHQISLDRVAAVKVMAKHLASNATFVERFYREARLMAKLDHPHIIRSFGVGQDHGYHYLAMEFVDGGSLQDCLKRQGKLSLGDAVHVIVACARALEHAHEFGVIHRDIKPDNVLLTRNGVVKLADLGLAKASEEDVALTQSGVGAGTPLYMAPEQAASAKHADARSDIYSLGCMFYCLLTGKPPFEGENTLALIKAKDAGKFTSVRRVNPEVPARLDLMLDKMIACKPEQRYQTCTELLKDLEGLGLASPTLSFFGDQARALAQTAVPSRPAASAPAVAAAPPPKPLPKPAADEMWQLSFTDASGKQVIKKMTTTEVKAQIAEPNFDLEAQARRNPSEQWRSLATVREFEASLKGRLVRAKVDRKAAPMRNLYDQIEEDERRQKRWGWLKKRLKGAKNGLLLVVWLAVLGGGFYGAYLLFNHFTSR